MLFVNKIIVFILCFYTHFNYVFIIIYLHFNFDQVNSKIRLESND